jgi:hypothetical protein
MQPYSTRTLCPHKIKEVSIIHFVVQRLALEDLPPDKVPGPRQHVRVKEVVNDKVPILGVLNPNLPIF